MSTPSHKSGAPGEDPFAGLEEALEYIPPRGAGDADAERDFAERDFAEREARKLLLHVWHAFFGRFGRLTSTQLIAIKPIVEGQSVVLCAATASGKTEIGRASCRER